MLNIGIAGNHLSQSFLPIYHERAFKSRFKSKASKLQLEASHRDRMHDLVLTGRDRYHCCPEGASLFLFLDIGLELGR